MRLKLSKLRNIIREALSAELDEMAYAETLPVGEEDTEANPKIVDQMKDFKSRGIDDRRIGSLDAYKKFHSSPIFREKAIKTFRNWSIPVYVAPIKRHEFAGPLHSQRTRFIILSADEGLRRISEAQKRAGTGYDLKELQEGLRSGGTVFAPIGTSLIPGGLGYPWMILHACFDTFPSILPGAVNAIFGAVGDTDDSVLIEAMKRLPNIKSLSPGHLGVANKGVPLPPDVDMENTVRDFAAEVLTKAALSELEIRPIESSEEFDEVIRTNVNKFLSDLKRTVDGLDVRGQLVQLLSGKVLFLKIYNNAD